MRWVTAFFLIAITGCVTTYVCPDGTTVTDPNDCPVEQPEPPEVEIEVPEPVVEEPIEEEPEPIEQEKNITPEVKVLINESKKVSSFSYMHYSPEKKGLGEMFYVKGNLMKRKLSKITEYYGRTFDTVYFDMETHYAEAYCEAEHTKCEDRNQVMDVGYDDLYVKTPLDWVNDITEAKAVGTERMENKIVTVIEFESEAASGRMWLRGAGLPMKVETEAGLYEFDNLVLNNVKDEEVTHQQLSNTWRD